MTKRIGKAWHVFQSAHLDEDPAVLKKVRHAFYIGAVAAARALRDADNGPADRFIRKRDELETELADYMKEHEAPK